MTSAWSLKSVPVSFARAPKPDELDVFTVIAHATSPRGNRREVPFEKSFLDDDGAFDVQRIAAVAAVKWERKLAGLTSAELAVVLDRLAERLGTWPKTFLNSTGMLALLIRPQRSSNEFSQVSPVRGRNQFVSRGRRTTTSTVALFLAIMFAGRMPRQFVFG